MSRITIPNYATLEGISAMVDFEEEFQTRHAGWVQFTKLMQWSSILVIVILVLMGIFLL
jgi:hypothetical protein